MKTPPPLIVGKDGTNINFFLDNLYICNSIAIRLVQVHLVEIF
jgi:hypothetical protein